MRTYIAPRTFRWTALIALIPFIIICVWMLVDRPSLIMNDTQWTLSLVDRRNGAAS